MVRVMDNSIQSHKSMAVDPPRMTSQATPATHPWILH